MQAFHTIPYGTKDLKKLVMLYQNNSNSIVKKTFQWNIFHFFFLSDTQVWFYEKIFFPPRYCLSSGKGKTFLYVFYSLLASISISRYKILTALDRIYIICTHAGLMLFSLNGIGRECSQVTWIKLHEEYVPQPLPSLLLCKTKQASLLSWQKAQQNRSQNTVVFPCEVL